MFNNKQYVLRKLCVGTDSIMTEICSTKRLIPGRCYKV